MQSQTLASGPGWRAFDNVCTAGPHDRPFEEQHQAVCIAAVIRGSFHYRSKPGAALLAPGAVLLGNYGCCFECNHEHGTGDRCLSFHFTPDYWDAVIVETPGARTAVFAAPRLPPLPALIPHVAMIEVASADRDGAELEELALRFAGAVTTALTEAGRAIRPVRRREERRISDAVRRIEAAAHEPSPEQLTLTALARDAAMSPYHFLRTFHQLVGVTPHQFVLRARLHRAAVRLRRSDEAISTVAFDAGFNDLSTFNRRFRRLMGVSPSSWRTQQRRGFGRALRALK